MYVNEKKGGETLKDYEVYRNNGNSEIKDNDKLKKLDNSKYLGELNQLPGEYFDCRENQIECELEDDDKFATDMSERGSTNTKSQVDDIQDLSNAVNSTATTSSSSSIVESVGSIATGTATVVVGASAAVVAFNATSKSQPKMNVNKIEAGSSYVYYDINVENLDTNKNYDILISNGQQKVKIRCSEGTNIEQVNDLKSNLEYTLTLIGYNELLGEVPYDSETFYTLPSERILGYSIINEVNNSDLTVGINYKTTIVDDYNKLADTYIVIYNDKEDVLYNSQIAEEFINDDTMTHKYKDKTYTGTINRVEPGIIYIDSYAKGYDVDDPDNYVLLNSESMEITNPINISADMDNLTISGDYGRIKDIKNIRIKKENLYAKMSIFNYKGEETFVEKEIDITNNDFNLTQALDNNTEYVSVNIGYYDASKKFTSVKKIDRLDISAYDPEFVADYTLWSNAIKIYGGYDIPDGITNYREKNIDYVLKIELTNQDMITTTINKNIELVDNKFSIKELLYQDTEYVSFDLGYYDGDEYISVKSVKNDLINHDIDMEINGVIDKNDMNILWNRNSDGEEFADITLNTNFDTDSDNEDLFYKVELLTRDWNWEDSKYEYVLLDEYIGVDNPVFKNVAINNEDGAEFTLRYYKIMKFRSYDESEDPEYEEVLGVLDYIDYESETQDATMFNLDNHMKLNEYTQIGVCATGDYYLQIFFDDESNNTYEFVDADITLHFYNSVGVKQESVQIHPKHIGYDYINTGWPIIVFDDELPANFDNINNLQVEYEINFHECYGGNNIRTTKSDGIENWYDLYFRTAVKEKKIVLHNDEHLDVTYELCAYAPSDCIIKLTSGESGEEYECVKNSETNTYTVTIPDISTSEISGIFYDSNGNERQNLSVFGATEDYSEYDYWFSNDEMSYNNTFDKSSVVFSYSSNGTTIYTFSDFVQDDNSDGHNPYEYSLVYVLNGYQLDDTLGDFVSTELGRVDYDGNNLIELATVNDINDYEYYTIDCYITGYNYISKQLGSATVVKEVKPNNQLVTSNLSTIYEHTPPSSEYDGNYTYDEGTGKTTYLIDVPADIYLDSSQKLILTVDGTNYEYDLADFLIPENIYNYGGMGSFYRCTIELDGDKTGLATSYTIKLNYTLTQEKYNKLNGAISDEELFKTYTYIFHT